MESPDGFCGPVNLGNPTEYTMLELAERIIALCGSRSEIIFKPLPSDDPARRRPDISLAKDLLRWEPKTSLNDGLARTIAYFRELRENAAEADLAPAVPYAGEGASYPRIVQGQATASLR
jgi:UDP-glucuronate decarboxylase